MSDRAGGLGFPGTYVTKIILEKAAGSGPEEILQVLDDLGIGAMEWTDKEGKAGKYVSWSVRLTFPDRESFDAMYARLKEVPGFKIAL